MQAGSKKGGKKATKLSLIKRTQKSETLASKSTDGIEDILRGKLDLNESCDFQQPLKSSGRGDCKVKADKDGKIQATAGTSKGIAEACSSNGSPDGTICCQVCKKNVGHMTLQCREQHVNRCIDRIEATEKQQKEEKHLLETARTAVLDCPMCGKQFKSENARLVHLKKCSVNVGVSTEKMLQLVKDQEKVRQEQVEAGIVPRELRSKISKTVASKKRKFKNPKNQFEEDVQVAMAISSSLASEQNIMDGQTSGDSVKDGKRKKAKKTVLEDVCLLTTLSDEDRKRRIEEKVSNILHMEYSVNRTNHSTLHDSTLKSGSQQNSHSLWKMCSQDPVALETEEFYVGALVPPLSVSQAEQGKRLRRLSSIPGREKSFVKKTEISQEKVSAGTPNMFAEDIITASTQTAVVLAELAVDDTNIHDSLVGSQLTQSPETEADLQASGFCVEKMVLNKSDQNALVSETLADFKKMINHKDYSDVTIVSCGQEFFAHKVVLAARCPKLLQMMQESTIALEVPPDIVLMFLNYIYTGDVTLTSSAQSELLNLASDLELPSLADACCRVVLHTEASETFAADGNLETSDTEFIESKLDMKEVWGESDSDLDSDKGDQSGNKESQSDSEINDAEYREICCTQKMKLRNEVTSKSDNSVVSNERNVISENICESSDSTFSSNELCNELKTDKSNEMESDPEQSVNASSPGKEKDAVSDVYHTDGGESDLYDIVDVDADEEPKKKRIRLSSENHFDEPIKDNDGSQKVLKNTDHKVIIDVNVDSTSSKLSYEYEDERASNEEETVDTSKTGFNSSTADLFGSPTPKKSNVALTEGEKFHSPQSYSMVSSPVENKTDLRRTLNTNIIPVIDIDSDSSFEDITDKETADKSQRDRAHNLHGENYTKTSLLNGDVSEKSEDNGVISEKELDRDEEHVSGAQQNKSSSCVDSSDDDLQITGDNFDDLSQHSPTVNQAKCGESRMQRLHVVSQKINATKYLGLKRMTEGISDKIQLKSSGSNCIGNGSMCRDESRNNNIEINSMHAEENNFSDVNSPKPFKVKHFKDKVSDSDEIVTIETEDSDACADQDMVMEMNRASPNDDLQSDVKLGDSDEPNIEKNPVPGNRKSAFYGKHEISVYSGAGDNTMACSPNQSFEENRSDVWDDFDDCGMSYEPPCDSPGETSPFPIHDPLEQNLRETSPVIGYQQQMENPGQVLPIIPEQDEVIDLSQNEDDNNLHSEHVDNELDSDLLEDGDDSFVFKVDDQPDVSDKPASLKSGNKGTAFKTPSVSEGRGKKRGAWVPPSPFTPMPQYGEMPTPALKKAVQKFGVKPVSKKRMVKVLEDIYHQTHQYETDSECEGDDGVEEELGTGQVEDTATASDQVISSQGDVSSQDSDISDVLEESCLHMSSDSDTSASPQKNLTQKLFDFVKSRPDIHRRILTYEPLELDVLKSDVKEAGIKCSMDKLMDFLDERCIAFTSKNSRKRQTGTRGRQKKTKTKQTVS